MDVTWCRGGQGQRQAGARAVPDDYCGRTLLLVEQATERRCVRELVNCVTVYLAVIAAKD
jgi:hypothetical protein